MLKAMIGSMGDEELLRFVAVAESECNPLTLELERRLAERVDKEFSDEESSKIDGLMELVERLEEDSGIYGLKQLANYREEEHDVDGLTKLVKRLEADVRKLVDENDALREQFASQRREDDTRNPRRTQRDVALELLPYVGASMPSHTLSKRLATLADTSGNVAGNAIRKLIEDGIFRSEGRGSSRTITRARSESA